MKTHALSLGRISAAAARNPWRVIVVWIIVWIIVMSALDSLAGPKLWQVTTNDTSHFLPNSYESMRAPSSAKRSSACSRTPPPSPGSSAAAIAGRSRKPTTPRRLSPSHGWPRGGPTGARSRSTRRS